MAEKTTPPKRTKVDIAHTIVRAGAGSIPVVGNAAAELFNMVVAPPLEKRLDEWRQSVGERLLELEDADRLTIDDLKDNEEFVSAVVKASQFAASTHDRTKRDALRNAVINTALGVEPDDSLRQMFLRFIDELSPSHIRVLLVLQDARKWFAEQGRPSPQYIITGSLSQLMGEAMPELKGQRDLLDLIRTDLKSRGLTNSGEFAVMMSGSGPFEKRSTQFGDRFLNFIAEPNGTSVK